MLRTAEETAEQLHRNHQALRGQENYTEADTIDFLILPLLDFWGYPTLHRRREHQHKGNRIDITLYDSPAPRPPRSQARAIIEAKPLGTDLSGRNKARANRPKEQLHRYLEDTPESQPGTYGILTDGNVWHILRRNAAGVNELIHEYRLLTDDIKSCIAALQEIRDLLSSQQTLHVFQPKTPTSKYQKAQALCNAVAEGKSPAEILRLITDQRISQDLTGAAALTGKARHAHNTHWDQYAFAPAGRIKVDQGDTDHEALCAAVLQANPAKDENDEILRREDVAVAAAAFAITAATKMALVLMIQPDQHDEPVSARLAVHHQGHTGMTAEFNPALPSPQILKTLQGTLDALNAKQTIASGKLADLVAAKGIRQEFYKKVARWTLRQYEQAEGSPEQRKIHRETVLRHLIRSIFTWILKEDSKLPLELFDEAFKRDHAEGQYHSQILTWLFHERLNKPPNDRIKHEIPALQATMQEVRFLNGSLFARHKHDAALQLSDADYFSMDSDNPGLFAIFSEYDWTANEHSVHSSDQAIDPEVLSSMFENLIAVTEQENINSNKMPAGTYYTPADVATEMVKDALVAAVKKQTPTGWNEQDLLNLFSEKYESLPDTTEAEKNLLRSRLQELTIFDPACGSGQFPFLMALTLRESMKYLGATENEETLTRTIITRQLFAQDINPMAVQIARLRLFIAIIAAEGGDQISEPALGTGSRNRLSEPALGTGSRNRLSEPALGTGSRNRLSEPAPLPNLEAKILCANTLATVANPLWQPFKQSGLQSSTIQNPLEKLTNLRAKWQYAHDEVSKDNLRAEDQNIRQQLQTAIKDGIPTTETEAFAEHPLLNPEAPPAQTDPRLLFYQPSWKGFDIIIGNPPYEEPSKSLSTAEIKSLQNKEYQTTGSKNLYTLLCEAALSLAKPQGGVVTLVTPLSIAFGQQQKTLRSIFENRCQEINLRHYDNIPDAIFNGSPVLKTWKNRQRATIITGILGQGKPVIQSSGLQSWRTSERQQCLTQRQKTIVPTLSKRTTERIASQWLRTPTPQIAELVEVISQQKRTVTNYAHKGTDTDLTLLAWPQTAYQFIGVIPAGTVQPRLENTIEVKDMNDLRMLMAVTNSHIGFAWWWIVGDGFILKHKADHGNLTVPDAYVAKPSDAIAIGQKLIEAIPQCTTSKKNAGTNWKNVNFHLNPNLMKEVDHLHLEALGYNGSQKDKLLKQLKIMRSSSSYAFPP